MVIPYSAPEGVQPWLENGLSKQVDGLRQALQPGEEVISQMTIDTDPYPIPIARIPEFARLEVRFEDTDRNLFEHRQVFNLVNHEKLLGLGLAYDGFFMLPLKKRHSAYDQSRMILMSDSADVIYERIGF